MTSAVLMASGGLDSTVLAWWMRSQAIDFVPLFIDYGQAFATTEAAHVGLVMPPGVTRPHHGDLSDFVLPSRSVLVQGADLWTATITAQDLALPYRNLLLLTAGATYAAAIGARSLYSAFINSNHALEVDATAAYLTSTSELFRELGPVSIEMPFRDMTKSQVARIGVDLGAPIERTFSCQVQGQTHCGACPNCVDRTTALASLR
jgi:7-cyano-7-deazaguanine synthase